MDGLGKYIDIRDDQNVYKPNLAFYLIWYLIEDVFIVERLI